MNRHLNLPVNVEDYRRTSPRTPPRPRPRDRIAEILVAKPDDSSQSMRQKELSMRREKNVIIFANLRGKNRIVAGHYVPLGGTFTSEDCLTWLELIFCQPDESSLLRAANERGEVLLGAGAKEVGWGLNSEGIVGGTHWIYCGQDHKMLYLDQVLMIGTKPRQLQGKYCISDQARGYKIVEPLLPVNRPSRFRKLCKERDGYKCCFTQTEQLVGGSNNLVMAHAQQREGYLQDYKDQHELFCRELIKDHPDKKLHRMAWTIDMLVNLLCLEFACHELYDGFDVGISMTGHVICFQRVYAGTSSYLNKVYTAPDVRIYDRPSERSLRFHFARCLFRHFVIDGRGFLPN